MAGLKHLAFRQGDRPQGLVFTPREFADNMHLTNGILLALINPNGHMHAVIMPFDFRLIDFDVDIAIIVVIGGNPLGVRLERFSVERPDAHEARQEILLAGRHNGLQPGILKRLIALKIYLGNAGRLLLLDRKGHRGFSRTELLGTIRDIGI